MLTATLAPVIALKISSSEFCPTPGLQHLIEARNPMIRLALVGGLLALLLSGGIAFADNCTEWSLQSDGSYWKECVDDQGQRHCWVSRNGQVSSVRCR